MHRREALKGLSLAGLTIATADAMAQATPPYKAPNHYRRVEPRASVSAGADRIEVVEFFSYACSHCHAIHPYIAPWAARLPAAVSFATMHVQFGAKMLPLQKLHISLQALGLEHQLAPKVFAAIHLEKKSLFTDEAIMGWVAAQAGVDMGAFRQAYSAFATRTTAQRHALLSQEYGIEGTPAFGVGGHFMVPGQGPERTLAVTSWLIDQERAGLRV